MVFFIILIILTNLQPVKSTDPPSILVMCDFLADRAVFSSESYNADVKAGSLLFSKDSSTNKLSSPSTSSSMIRTPAEHEKIGQETADLERCLTILRAMMNKDNHIHLNLLSYNHLTQRQSREYEDQMVKLEQLLLHGRDLIQTFITIKLHKYSPNFCKTLVEDYFHGNTKIVNVITGIHPPVALPSILPTDDATLKSAGKQLKGPSMLPKKAKTIHIGEKLVAVDNIDRAIGYRVYWAHNRQMDATINMLKQNRAMPMMINQITMVTEGGDLEKNDKDPIIAGLISQSS